MTKKDLCDLDITIKWQKYYDEQNFTNMEYQYKKIQEYIEKIYDISKISNISEEEIKELFKMIFEEEI